MLLFSYRITWIVVLLIATGCEGAPPTTAAKAAPPARMAPKIAFDGAASFEYLKQICAIGPRYSGSKGMREQQALLVEHFQKLGANVTKQEFQARHPQSGGAVQMANLIIQWHPERKERVLLVAHYDTRPLPDRDPRNPRGNFIGANDGGSGVAVLMELGKAMPKFDSPLGVDFLLVDGEELVFREGDPYCLGSAHFARQYFADPPEHQYRWGVVLDMVGGRNARFFQESNSAGWRDTLPLVEQIWATAARLGVREFVAQIGEQVTDDHIPLHDIAHIPTCDIIGWPYQAWHTQADTPAQCSAATLGKVGWVIFEWLKEQK
ncbi:MAG: M28 family peptidase [Pirellulales bacterium]|nr:M28 family peptidase [Pirellulales bacterium]